MACRMVVIVDEAAMFYAVQANVYEIDDDNHRTPVMTRMVTHAKAELDGFEGAVDALKQIL